MSDFETKQLETLTKRVEIMQEKVEAMDKNVHELLLAINGRGNKTQPGLFNIIDDHEERIEAIEQFKNKGISLTMGVALMGAITGVMSSKAVEFLKKLIS